MLLLKNLVKANLRHEPFLSRHHCGFFPVHSIACIACYHDGACFRS